VARDPTPVRTKLIKLRVENVVEAARLIEAEFSSLVQNEVI
jgi:hypothetical protein